MSAKYYIYRNLHTKTFSVRYRGKVIAHPTSFTAHNAIFKVNELGRQRVLQLQCKNVHAFVVCDSWSPYIQELKLNYKRIPIHYNPYLVSLFLDENFQPVEYADEVIGCNGKDLYVNKGA